jgi:hypothetical protein
MSKYIKPEFQKKAKRQLSKTVPQSIIESIKQIGDDLYMIKINVNLCGHEFMHKFSTNGFMVRAMARLCRDDDPDFYEKTMGMFAYIDIDEDAEELFELKELDTSGFDFEDDVDVDEHTHKGHQSNMKEEDEEDHDERDEYDQ